MTHHMEVLLEVSDVRGIVALMVIDEPIAPIVVDVARDTLEAMLEEAAKYGLTDADVIRAVLQPVFQKKRGCECYSCKSRRAEASGWDSSDSLAT